MKYIELSQQIEYYTINKLADKLKNYINAIERYAYIVHDKDGKAPHFHCYIEFKSKGYTIERLEKMFDIQNQFIIKPKEQGLQGFNNCLLYATHRTPKAIEQKKHLYDFNEVTSNFNYEEEIVKIENEITNAKESKERTMALIEQYADFKLSLKMLMNKLTFKEYNLNKKAIDNAKIWRDNKARSIGRNMKVIYITGGAGTGKTTLAKFFAQSMGLDYFVSGSGKDVLDGYDCEECIILDDLRADAFTKSELFKFLDNNTGSSVKSRYYNKAINHCRLLVITSIKEPSKLYDWNDQNDDEPAKQFVRRLSGEFLEVVGKTILEWTMDENDCAKLVCKTFPLYTMEDVFAVMGIVNRDSGLSDIFIQSAKSIRQKLENELKEQDQELPF